MIIPDDFLGEKAPIDVYNKNGLRVMFHLGKDTPHPSITVIVASYINLGNTTLNDFVFQAAVPKVSSLRL